MHCCIKTGYIFLSMLSGAHCYRYFYIFRKKWVSVIEEVKAKLEDDETMDVEGPGDENDPNNPFSRRGEKRGKRGKCKVVSIF